MIKRTTFLVCKVLDNADIKMQLDTVERDKSTGYRGRSFHLFERPHGARQGRKDDVYVCSEVAFKCIRWVNDFEKDLFVFRRNVGPFRLN